MIAGRQILHTAHSFVKGNKLITFFGTTAIFFLLFGNNQPVKQQVNITEKKSFKENDVLMQQKLDYVTNERDATLTAIQQLKKRIADLEAKQNSNSKQISQAKSVKDQITSAIAESKKRTLVADRVSQQFSGTKKNYRRKHHKLSFPVAFKNETSNISIPKGSRVKATMLTGMQSGYGGKEPVLIAFDKEMILPNHYEVDLTGCVALGKASGDESKERVCIEVYSLACIDNDGKSIEKDIRAFIVDDRDSTHCAIGKVNTKGHKAVYKAALAEMIAGAGRILQAGTAITNVSPLGGVTKILSGSNAKNVLGGGMAKGAQTLANWWINQANIMMPTIDVEAGRPIWVITLESFKVPKHFLNEKEKTDEIFNDSILL